MICDLMKNDWKCISYIYYFQWIILTWNQFAISSSSKYASVYLIINLFDNICLIREKNMIETDTISPAQNGLRSNYNEGVLNTPQNSRTKASQLDAF